MHCQTKWKRRSLRGIYKKVKITNIYSEKGFSFIEIMIIVVIIGLILAIAMPNYMDAKINAAKKVCESNQKIIFTAATMYQLAESGSLENIDEDERLQALIDGEYIRGGKWGECPASGDNDYNDYDILFQDNVVSDVECKQKPSDHVWP